MFTPRFLFCLSVVSTVSMASQDAEANTAKKACVQVQPTKAIGPFDLGMTIKDVEKIGAVEDGGIDVWKKVGHTELQFDKADGDDRKVVAVRHSLNSETCLEMGTQPRLESDVNVPEAIASWLGNCGALETRTGGNVLTCEKGVTVLQHMGGVDIEVRADAATQSKQAKCAGYVAPGQGAWLPGKGKVDMIDVEPGKTYCGGSRQFTTELVEADVLGKLRFNTCDIQRNRGATVATCPYQGMQMIFAGPKGALHKISSVAMKK
ncbi:MAG: hypothetical protein ACE366_16275 [Bradymonadia bacterium]